MVESLLNRQGNSRKTLIILSIAFAISLVVVVLVAYALAKLTGEKITQSRQLKYSPPTESTISQVKRILLKRHTDHGDEFLEILADGTVNLYDSNMHLIKSGLQGLGRLTYLFNNFNDLLKSGGNRFTCPDQYILTIYTTLGTFTCVPANGSSGGSGSGDLINEIVDIVDDTFAPTPTRSPTSTPALLSPSHTPTPALSYYPSPRVTDPDWNPLTPTPLPGYMTAPPFSCSDYHFNHPFTISNVICGAD